MTRTYQARNAARGIAIERRAQAELESAGYLVTRAAGSHGPFDLIAMRRDACRHIQVKSIQRRLRSRTATINELADQPLPDSCTRELWVWLYGQGWIEQSVIPGAES